MPPRRRKRKRDSAALCNRQLDKSGDERSDYFADTDSGDESGGEVIEKLPKKLMPSARKLREKLYEIGTRLEAKDAGSDTWYPVKIVEVDHAEDEILIHYENWSQRYDEWITMDSSRLRPTQNHRPTRKMTKVFNVGEKVMATWSDSRKYQAEIKAVLPGDRYEVLFYDGFVKTIKGSRILKIEDLDGTGEVSSEKSSVRTSNFPQSTCLEPTFTKEERRLRMRKLNVAELFHTKRRKKSQKKGEITDYSDMDVENKKKHRTIPDVASGVESEFTDDDRLCGQESGRQWKSECSDCGTDGELKKAKGRKRRRRLFIRPSKRKSAGYLTDASDYASDDNEQLKCKRFKKNLKRGRIKSFNEDTPKRLKAVSDAESSKELGEISGQEGNASDHGNGKKIPVILKDSKIPEGWQKVAVQRKSGYTAGKWDVYYVCPEGQKLRKRSDVVQYFRLRNQPYVAEAFDFSFKQKPMRLPDDVCPSLHSSCSDQRTSSPLLSPLKDEVSELEKPPQKKLKTLLPRVRVPVSEGERSVLHSHLHCLAEVPGAPNKLEDNVNDDEVIIGSLKIKIKEGLFECPNASCGKLLRKEQMLLMHIKHYHQELNQFMGTAPNVADLAYARTVGENFSELVPKIRSSTTSAYALERSYHKESICRGKATATVIDKKDSFNVGKIIDTENKEPFSRGIIIDSGEDKKEYLGQQKSVDKIIDKEEPFSRVKSIEITDKKDASSKGKTIDTVSDKEHLSQEKTVSCAIDKKNSSSRQKLEIPAKKNTNGENDAQETENTSKPFNEDFKDAISCGYEAVESVVKEDFSVDAVPPVTKCEKLEEITADKMPAKVLLSDEETVVIPKKVEENAEKETPTFSDEVLRSDERSPEEVKNTDTSTAELVSSLMPMDSDIKQEKSDSSAPSVIMDSEESSDRKTPTLMMALKTPVVHLEKINFSLNSNGRVNVNSISNALLTGNKDSDTEENSQKSSTSDTQQSRQSSSREEIINCACGLQEEDGLMMQCEVCLCWQHGSCNNIDNVNDVPEKYVCNFCLHPSHERPGMKYAHFQDWLVDGKLPRFPYVQNDPLCAKFEETLRQCHNLTTSLLRVRAALKSVGVKIETLSKSNHPKLYLWEKEWSAINSPEESLEDSVTGNDNFMNGGEEEEEDDDDDDDDDDEEDDDDDDDEEDEDDEDDDDGAVANYEFSATRPDLMTRLNGDSANNICNGEETALSPTATFQTNVAIRTVDIQSDEEVVVSPEDMKVCEDETNSTSAVGYYEVINDMVKEFVASVDKEHAGDEKKHNSISDSNITAEPDVDKDETQDCIATTIDCKEGRVIVCKQSVPDYDSKDLEIEDEIIYEESSTCTSNQVDGESSNDMITTVGDIETERENSNDKSNQVSLDETIQELISKNFIQTINQECELQEVPCTSTPQETCVLERESARISENVLDIDENGTEEETRVDPSPKVYTEEIFTEEIKEKCMNVKLERSDSPISIDYVIRTLQIEPEVLKFQSKKSPCIKNVTAEETGVLETQLAVLQENMENDSFPNKPLSIEICDTVTDQPVENNNLLKGKVMEGNNVLVNDLNSSKTGTGGDKCNTLTTDAVSEDQEVITEQNVRDDDSVQALVPFEGGLLHQVLTSSNREFHPMSSGDLQFPLDLPELLRFADSMASNMESDTEDKQTVQRVAPQPEALIETPVCQQNLATHITQVHNNIRQQLTNIEKMCDMTIPDDDVTDQKDLEREMVRMRKALSLLNVFVKRHCDIKS